MVSDIYPMRSGKQFINNYDPTLYTMDGCILSEVDWGAHDSSLFLYLMYIDHYAKPKDFFTQGFWGGLPQRTSSSPPMEYLRDSVDTGQIEDGFSNSKSIKGYRSSYFLPDPVQHESRYNLLTQWDSGEKLLQIYFSGRKAQASVPTASIDISVK